MPKLKFFLLFLIAFSVLPAPASLAQFNTGFRQICRVRRGLRECYILPQNRNQRERDRRDRQRQPESDSDAQEIRKYIEEDPEGIFRTVYTSDNPQANFQFIALRNAEGYSYQEIAEEIGIPYQTL